MTPDRSVTPVIYFDVVIVGAGLHGLATARALVDTSPNNPKRLIILDEGGSIGGTWAAERFYPGLKTNNIVGSYEFSDFPMEPERYGLKPGQHIPGYVVHRYLTGFAFHFSLDKLFSQHTKVETVLLQRDGKWQFDYKCFSKDGPEAGQLTCDKLVIATSLTSEARMPTFPGNTSFRGPLFHAKDLHARSKDLKGCQEVVVVGGNKSAWDVCYSVATTGARARMVIRPSGGGLSWVWRPIYIFGIKLTLARLSSTRLFTCFDPSPFGKSFSSAALDFLAASATGYSDPRLIMLRPWTSTFWMGNSLSIHNYGTDWFDLARKGQIVVHHADVTSLDGTTAHLSDGSKLKADDVVCCTGWKCKPPIRFEPEGISEDIGLPQEITSHRQDSGNLGFSPRRTLPKDDKIQAKGGLTLKIHSNTPLAFDFREVPYRLYRFLVPASPRFLELRNIAFIGMYRSVHAVMVAQAQALIMDSGVL
ncbi:FAD/NAD(P)-binding domain-containing protein [Xylariaceae sp. AK1471]|nr:FAD/NAD(P)-binding domain-containing protein [Xylariaceae sp. AK1471]